MTSEKDPSPESARKAQSFRLVIAGIVGMVIAAVVLVSAFLLFQPAPDPKPTSVAAIVNPTSAPTNDPPSPTLPPTATPAPTAVPATPTPTSERPGWKLAWSDEFNAAAGTPPNPAVWSYEIGDGTANGNRGWGNNELEYYTDSPQNSAHDGQGNLVLTVRPGPPNNNATCYYGPCQYTSARLITANKIELTFGRIEARIKVPRGAGLWPAFWALGTDISKVGWPQSGEIDIMEYIGRQPQRIFGTIHGPGYSGANGFSKTKDLPQDLADDFHVFAVEWETDQIVWSVDNIVYNRANPNSVAPHQWVFNHSFFLLLNVAVGGNLGGAIGPDTTFPQYMIVDYVRQYQKIQ